MSVRIKRVYEPPGRDDGRRVLVDRFWPRGLSKDNAAVDDWVKDIAPSDEVRKWFGHRDERWEEFRAAYLRELAEHRERLVELCELARSETVTLVFGAKNVEHNNAVVIREWLEREMGDR